MSLTKNAEEPGRVLLIRFTYPLAPSEDINITSISFGRNRLQERRVGTF